MLPLLCFWIEMNLRDATPITGRTRPTIWVDITGGGIHLMKRFWQKDYANHLEAINDIADYIVGFYNSLRLHSKLGNLSPNAFLSSVNRLQKPYLSVRNYLTSTRYQKNLSSFLPKNTTENRIKFNAFV